MRGSLGRPEPYWDGEGFWEQVPGSTRCCPDGHWRWCGTSDPDQLDLLALLPAAIFEVNGIPEPAAPHVTAPEAFPCPPEGLLKLIARRLSERVKRSPRLMQRLAGRRRRIL